MNWFRKSFVTLDCPNCCYGMDVELISIQLQERMFLPLLQSLDSTEGLRC